MSSGRVTRQRLDPTLNAASTTASVPRAPVPPVRRSPIRLRDAASASIGDPAADRLPRGPPLLRARRPAAALLIFIRCASAGCRSSPVRVGSSLEQWDPSRASSARLRHRRHHPHRVSRSSSRSPARIGGAIFLSSRPPGFGRRCRPHRLLAAVPSVVFGLWGIFFLLPSCAARDALPPRHSAQGATPFFSGRLRPERPRRRVDLAIMVLPYIAAAPAKCYGGARSQREAASPSAPRAGKRTGAVVPYARTGIFGGVLGLGRASADMPSRVHRNRHELSASLFARLTWPR